MSHFSDRAKQRIPVKISARDEKDIKAIIIGHKPGYLYREGGSDNPNCFWYAVRVKGVKFYVLFDKKQNRLVTCLSDKTRPLETIWEERERLLSDIAFHEREIERLNKKIDSISAEIIRQEGIKA